MKKLILLLVLCGCASTKPLPIKEKPVNYNTLYILALDVLSEDPNNKWVVYKQCSDNGYKITKIEKRKIK